MRPAGAPVIVILIVVAWAAALPQAWQHGFGPRPIRDRVTWGRGPEPGAAAATPALVDARACEDWTYATTLMERARPSGVDLEKFLRGHLYQFDVPGVERHEISTWELARSIHEAKLGPRVAAILRTEAGRPNLDDYNRYRAAETLVFLRDNQVRPATGSWSEAQKYQRYQYIRDVRAELESLGLPPAAKDWISSVYFY